MTYDNINPVLLEKLPELAREFEEEHDYWEGEKVPSHILYEKVLNHSGFMANLLLQDCDTMLIERVFDFFEEMANCDDEEVRNLLQVTILEYLWSDYEMLSCAHKYMHARTRKICDEIQAYFRPFTDEEKKTKKRVKH